MRTASGAPPYPTAANTEGGGYNIWGGVGGKFPGVLLMFGQMEDKVSLYAGGTQPPAAPGPLNVTVTHH